MAKKNPAIAVAAEENGQSYLFVRSSEAPLAAYDEDADVTAKLVEHAQENNFFDFDFGTASKRA